MNFVGRVLERATVDPGRPAVLTEHDEWSYGELMHAVAAVSRLLHDRGVSPGDRVGLALDNSFAWIAAYLGAMHAGAVAVPLSPSLTDADHEQVVRATGMGLAFVNTNALTSKHGWLHAVAHVVQLDDSADLLSGAATSLAPPEPRAREDLAALLFSSGSTGRPRAVMISHGNLLANTGSIVAALGLSSADRAMMVLPFHYCYGASVLHTHLAVGGSVSIDRRFLFADKVLQRMIETRCTGFAGVPSHFQILLRRSHFPTMRFPDLRWMQQAGGKLPEPFVRELRAVKPDVKLFVMYGATEATARISVLPPDEVDRRPGSIGKPIPGVSVRLLDEDGNEAPPGAPGQIVVEGENVARGYLGDSEEDLTTFREGRLFTGDLATRDADGFLYVVDRMKNFLKCGGVRTSAARIEEALLAFEDIVEAAVIGVPDEMLGEAVAAFIVPREPGDLTLAIRLLNFARAKLPPALQPAVVKVLPELPKSSAGKVIRRSLRQHLEDRPSAIAAA